MVKDLLNAIPVLIITLVATVTSGTALSRVADELKPTLAKTEHSLQEANTIQATISPTVILPTDTTNQAIDQNTEIVLENTTLSSSGTANARAKTTSTTSFSTATLAQHNTPGNCYIAYKGIVYNVSTHPSWSTCFHHGIRGGRDITLLFPHSTTYFATLARVGTIQVTSTTTGARTHSDTSIREVDDSHEEFEDEEEYEYEHEDD